MTAHFTELSGFDELRKSKEKKYNEMFEFMIKYIEDLKGASKADMKVEELYFQSMRQLLSQENLIKKQKTFKTDIKTFKTVLEAFHDSVLELMKDS